MNVIKYNIVEECSHCFVNTSSDRVDGIRPCGRGKFGNEVKGTRILHEDQCDLKEDVEEDFL